MEEHTHHDHQDHHHNHVHDEHHGHDHEHAHDHPYEDRDHPHSPIRFIAWLQHSLAPHSHGHHQAALDPNLATDRGIWAVKVSLVALMVTAIFQLAIVATSGSVALLADTIHNFSDALTAVP